MTAPMRAFIAVRKREHGPRHDRPATLEFFDFDMFGAVRGISQDAADRRDAMTPDDVRSPVVRIAEVEIREIGGGG